MEENEEKLKSDNDQKIDDLLLEFVDHRVEIKKMINELEVIRENIDRILPTSLDARYVRFFEEKIKTITSLFNSLLEMRKEILKSVKDEIDIRRRMIDKEADLNFEDLLDVRGMAKTIDEFKAEHVNKQRSRLEKIKEQTVDKSIEIPGITSEIGGTKND